MKTEIKQGYISIGLQIASVVILILISIQIPNLLQNPDLFLSCDTPENNPGMVTVHIFNYGDYISNGTITLLLLKNGVYKLDELEGYIGSLSHNAGKNYEFEFNEFISPSTNYSIYIRVDADSRSKDLTEKAYWYS